LQPFSVALIGSKLYVASQSVAYPWAALSPTAYLAAIDLSASPPVCAPVAGASPAQPLTSLSVLDSTTIFVKSDTAAYTLTAPSDTLTVAPNALLSICPPRYNISSQSGGIFVCKPVDYFFSNLLLDDIRGPAAIVYALRAADFAAPSPSPVPFLTSSPSPTALPASSRAWAAFTPACGALQDISGAVLATDGINLFIAGNVNGTDCAGNSVRGIV